MGPRTETCLPKITTTLHLASSSQQSRSSLSMPQLHDDGSQARRSSTSVNEAGRLLLQTALPWSLCLHVGTGPSLTPQAWPLCRSMGPPAPPLGHARLGRNAQAVNCHGGRRGLLLRLLPGTSGTFSRESLVGYARAPKSGGKQRQIGATEGSGLTSCPNLLWLGGGCQDGGHGGSEDKSPAGTPFPGSPSAYGNMYWVLVAKEKTEAQGAQSSHTSAQPLGQRSSPGHPHCGRQPVSPRDP